MIKIFCFCFDFFFLIFKKKKRKTHFFSVRSMGLRKYGDKQVKYKR